MKQTKEISTHTFIGPYKEDKFAKFERMMINRA